MPVPAPGRSPGSGEESTTVQVFGAVSRSRSESEMNDWTLAGRNFSNGSKCMTGWYVASSLGAGVAACKAPAAAANAIPAIASTTARWKRRFIDRCLL
jgi:hypothetical protein